MHDESAAMFIIDLDAEVLELFIIKFLVVVGDDDPRKAELANDGFSYKLFSLGLDDLGHWLSFHPFGEVVDGYK